MTSRGDSEADGSLVAPCGFQVRISSPERPRKIAHWSRAGSGVRGWAGTAPASRSPLGVSRGLCPPRPGPGADPLSARRNEPLAAALGRRGSWAGASPEPCPRLGGSTDVGRRGTRRRSSFRRFDLGAGRCSGSADSRQHLRRAVRWGLNRRMNKSRGGPGPPGR